MVATWGGNLGLIDDNTPESLQWRPTLLNLPPAVLFVPLPFSAVSPPPFHPPFHRVCQHFRSSLPRILSPASLAQCWYIQHWFWLWQMKVDCFASFWRNRVIVIYNSFMTFDDCGSWGRSSAAELVSLCKNPILKTNKQTNKQTNKNPIYGRTPFSSTKVSDLPRRKDSFLINDTEHPQARTPLDQFPQRQNRFLRVTELFHKFHRLLR